MSVVCGCCCRGSRMVSVLCSSRMVSVVCGSRMVSVVVVVAEW